METFIQYIENRERQYSKAASDALALKYSGVDASNDSLTSIRKGLEKLGEKKPTHQTAARVKHVAKGTFDPEQDLRANRKRAKLREDA